MDAETDILHGKLWNSLINVDNAESGSFDEGIPIFQGSSIFAIVRFFKGQFLKISLWSSRHFVSYTLTMFSCCWLSDP